MKTVSGLQRIAAFSILAAMCLCAMAAQPPNNVVSDSDLNTAMGTDALLSLVGGEANTAAGEGALKYTTRGNNNTAVGTSALVLNITGNDNSAVGVNALAKNSSGYSNVAVGARALLSNSTGGQNSALGSQALYFNTTGSANTATGGDALYKNVTGSYNTSAGVASMSLNTTGSENTANGYSALYNNTTGNSNTANGVDALYFNTTGIDNTAMGHMALFYNDAGNRNVSIGFQAGYAVTGSDNITIGGDNEGKAAESGVTRIGTKAYQKKAFIAGISGVKTGLATAKTVFIDANGQLGTIKSSRIYKEDIRPMGSVSERLLDLRPVTFRYKEAYDDGSKPIEFGLIAEDVAEVFPELVVNDSEGKPETVRYDLIATLMLNEFEKEHAELAELKKQVAGMAAIIELLERERVAAAARQP